MPSLELIKELLKVSVGVYEMFIEQYLFNDYEIEIFKENVQRLETKYQIAMTYL